MSDSIPSTVADRALSASRVANGIAVLAIIVGCVAATFTGCGYFADNDIRIEVSQIERNEMPSADPGISFLILKNPTKRDVSISAVRFDDDPHRAFVAVSGKENSYSIQLVSGGSEILSLFRCQWAISIVDAGINPETFSATFVTGVGDSSIDLPPEFESEIVKESADYKQDKESYKGTCQGKIAMMRILPQQWTSRPPPEISPQAPTTKPQP